MTKLLAPVPPSYQKNGITHLSIEFDPSTDGWYLYGLDSVDGVSPLIELWNMSETDAKSIAAGEWGIPEGSWDGESNDTAQKSVDSNGTPLLDGDSVSVIKDLPLKGSSTVIKRGTIIKRIALTSNPEEIDCYGGPIKGLVLKTCFVKKVI